VPEAELPEHGERRDDPPGVGMVVGLLAASLQHCCAEARVAASLVGSQSDLRDLIRWHQEGTPVDAAPSLATGWRAAVCGTTLSDVLAGRRALRIVDPASETPVALVPLDAEADATGP
jgi:ribonuclease D